ncbi:hypothetical protein JOE11_004593 [Robbsia andropogonis]|uniref:hypothetical protein n=1 Tax=Robbsia andropogonis TaxID=28092 RepID=UPI00209E80EE|nr:hypothetical protein [Robbsia andropogonis]MCP1119999.1 hypothetical protein [Robbsia andropogonis]MCP1129942.1 hypothetical protein [Robbsia andropogonis]
MRRSPSPHCVVITWDADKAAFVVNTLEASKISELSGRAMKVPLAVSELDNGVDDEFARQLGALAVGLLQLTNPEIKPINRITPHPEA